MPASAIDTYRLLNALKATGKSANYTAEEIAGAVDAAQQGSELVTKSLFEARMNAFEAKFDAKLDALRAEIRAELKSGLMQNLLWLSGIMLASNGAVIALLARLAGVV